jgi:hypothetical protein
MATHHKDKLHPTHHNHHTAMVPLLRRLNMADTPKYVDLYSFSPCWALIQDRHLHSPATAAISRCVSRLKRPYFTTKKLTSSLRVLLQVNMVLQLLLSTEAALPHQVPIILIPIQLTLGQVLIVLCSPPQHPTKRLQPRKS